MAEKLITVREVAHILDISEQEVIDIAEQAVIPAYKIAGTHLRFRRDQINRIRHLDHIKFKTRSGALKYSLGERVRDFFYFNDFYLVSAALIAFMAWIILR